LREVRFKDCKLLGLNFNDCNTFLMDVFFENCQLSLVSFYKLPLKDTVFKNCNLQEADFTEADLSAAVFENCDLERSVFENTVLEKTDFRTAFNYNIDPSANRIQKAKFSTNGLQGLLTKYNLDIE